MAVMSPLLSWLMIAMLAVAIGLIIMATDHGQLPAGRRRRETRPTPKRRASRDEVYDHEVHGL